MGKGRAERPVRASEQEYKQAANGLFALLSACALLPQGGNATYSGWRAAKCMLQGAMERRGAPANGKRRVRQRRK